MITMRQFAPGETIIKEGDHGETAFVIERGKVEVVKSRDGKRMHIAFLEQGATFGEMSMVDDMPRSAAVVAVEETLLREIHRDDLRAAMQANPDTVLNLLKSIFERLREANVQIARLGGGDGAPDAGSAAPGPSKPAAPAQGASEFQFSFHAKPTSATAQALKAAYYLEGLTDKAMETLSGKPMPIMAFPFKIGRRSHDPLAHNHLAIDDTAPLQISRHHVSIIKEGDRLGVSDRGSQLGARVDGTRIGGNNGPGPVFFKGAEGVLVLGNDHSPYKYRIRPAA